TSRADWQFLDSAVPDKLRQLHSDGYAIVIFSNQGGIANKFYDEAKAHMIPGKIDDITASVGIPMLAFVATTEPLIDRLTPDSGINLGVHVAQERWYLMRGVSSSGAAVHWAGTLLGAAVDEAPYTRLEALAGNAPPGSMGVLFVPRLTGGDRGAFVGLTADSGPTALARAGYEGL
ncbi:MAG TPA: FGGY-family carbohydrate kinase, partial [Roseiflexaceae bacterium]|nr:FGGY-family carbohydrate kinase [Roseiflexaceae bacterium]